MLKYHNLVKNTIATQSKNLTNIPQFSDDKKIENLALEGGVYERKKNQK